MKLLYFGDRHNSIELPPNRLDDFRETMLKKDLEILEIARRENVKYILQPGDFWDEPLPPLDFSASIIKRWFNVDVFGLLQKILTTENVSGEEIKKELHGFIPMVGVVGNHELFGNNINTLDRTLIGFMNKMGLINLVTKENPLIFDAEPGFKVAITGANYHIDIDTPARVDDYVVHEKLGDIHIHIAHGMLTGKPMHPNARYTSLDQVTHTKADLTLTGDDHIGYPLTEVDGKYFVNTGAVPRLSADKKEIGRTPKVLLIDITKEHGLRLKEIPLGTALPGNVILNTQASSQKKEKKKQIEGLREIAKKATDLNGMDIFDIISQMSIERGISSEIKEELLNLLSKKQEALGTLSIRQEKSVYIKKVILENVMSHKYTELNLSAGFNVFAGESRKGKSVVMRAFRWIVRNDVKRKRMIRKNADFAQATIELSNGYIVSRYSDAMSKSNGKNGYYITDPSTGEREFYNTQILTHVQELIGYVPFRIDEDKNNELDLNFMKQGDKWFFIEESDPFKAKVIGAIYGTHYADAVLREVSKLDSKTCDEIEKLISKYASKSEEIGKFSYLDNMKEAISEFETIVGKIEELTVRKNKLESLNKERILLVNRLSEANNSIALTNHLEVTSPILVQLKKTWRTEESISQMNAQRKRIGKNIAYSNHVLKITSHVEELYIIKQALGDKLSQFEQIGKLSNKRNRISNRYMELERESKVFAVPLIIQKDIEKIKPLIDKYESLVKNYTQFKTAKKMVTFSRKVINFTSNIDNSIEIMTNASAKLTTLELIRKLKNHREPIFNRYSESKEVVSVTECLSEKVAVSEEIKKKFDKLNTLKLLRENVGKTSKQVNESRKLVSKYSLEIEQYIKEYHETLHKDGQCPLCFGAIETDAIKRIVTNLRKREGV